MKEISVLPWLVQSAQYKIFFSSLVHYFNAFVPIAQQAGQAAMLGHLSLRWVSFHDFKKYYAISSA